LIEKTDLIEDLKDIPNSNQKDAVK